MNLLDNPQTTCPIMIGWEISVEPYPNWQFGWFDNAQYIFGDSSIPTCTQTSRCGPEQLHTLLVSSLRVSRMIVCSFRTHLDFADGIMINGPCRLLSNFLPGHLVFRFYPFSIIESPGWSAGGGFAFLSWLFPWRFWVPNDRADDPMSSIEFGCLK